MNTKKTITVINGSEEIKVRTRCADFGNVSDCAGCRRCQTQKNRISEACQIKSDQIKAEQVKEEKSELESAQEIIKKLQDDLAKAQGEIKDLTEELHEVKEARTIKPKVKRRKGTKLDVLKKLVKEGIFTKAQLMQKLSVSANTLGVYLTKLRNELGMNITKGNEIIQCV